MFPLHLFFKTPTKSSERWLTLANGLTTVRILLIPSIVHAITSRNWEQGTFLFACAALTDLFDGMVARWRSETTLLGACLDPLADKLLLICSLGALSATPNSVCTIPGWFFSLVLAKEAALVGGIVLLIGLGGKIELNPTIVSKYATAAQFALLFLAVWSLRICCAPAPALYGLLLAASTLLTIAALVQYSSIGLRILVKSMLRGQL